MMSDCVPEATCAHRGSFGVALSGVEGIVYTSRLQFCTFLCTGLHCFDLHVVPSSWKMGFVQCSMLFFSCKWQMDPTLDSTQGQR